MSNAEILTVPFISSELAESEPDLIVAFAIVPADDPMGLNNLILVRNPKYEVLLPPEEQRVSVSYDGRGGEEKSLLQRVELEGEMAEVLTDARRYSLDLQKVEREEIALMREALRRMNFDGNSEMKGV